MSNNDHQIELGARLRDIRQQQGLTLQQVEEASGGHWKAVVVGSYERGDRAVSVAKLAQLAAFYRVPVAELLPKPETAAPSARSERRPRLVLDLTRLEPVASDGADTPLSRYARTIQLQRGDYNGQILTLRAADVQALSSVLGVGADELVTSLGRRGVLRHT